MEPAWNNHVLIVKVTGCRFHWVVVLDPILRIENQGHWTGSLSLNSTPHATSILPQFYPFHVIPLKILLIGSAYFKMFTGIIS